MGVGVGVGGGEGDGETRERLVELLQDVAHGAGRLGQAFATEQGLPRTDGHARLAVSRAERAGEVLTEGSP